MFQCDVLQIKRRDLYVQEQEKEREREREREREKKKKVTEGAGTQRKRKSVGKLLQSKEKKNATNVVSML